jgi:hypothetical protein
MNHTNRIRVVHGSKKVYLTTQKVGFTIKSHISILSIIIPRPIWGVSENTAAKDAQSRYGSNHKAIAITDAAQ